MVQLYLKLTQEDIMQYDYGISLGGSVFEDKQLKIPHSLAMYDTIRVTLSRKDNNRDLVDLLASKVDGVGNEHKWSMIIPEGTFLVYGIFYMNNHLQGTGIDVSTYPQEFHVRENVPKNG